MSSKRRRKQVLESSSEESDSEIVLADEEGEDEDDDDDDELEDDDDDDDEHDEGPTRRSVRVLTAIRPDYRVPSESDEDDFEDDFESEEAEHSFDEEEQEEETLYDDTVAPLEDEEEEEEEELEEEADEEEEPPQGEMKLPRIKISYKGTGTTPKRDRRGEPKAESQQTEEMLRKAERTAHRKRQAYKQLVAEKDAIIERLLNLKGKEEDDRPPQVVDVVRRAPPKPPTPPHYRWRYTPTECSLSISSDAPTPDWLTLPARST
mmetsp:Transcript_654/g.1996  ORF Transcript_654/g.1996 Transcript_654/m.1996 type:complete len:263 (-) Transcript_654:29-817(-)